MYIKSIKLKNFRNYRELQADFSSKVNFLLGQNAQGKTNLLESIYITSMGKSFRTNRDSEMISFGKDFSSVSAEIVREDDIEGSVEIVIDKSGKKSVKIDGVKIKKASQLLENVYIVIFSPEDLKIVKDEPEKRRKFIDRELCQIKPAYYESLSNYKKVLLQRNAYLKEEIVDPSVLDIWDMQLSEYGLRVMKHRAEFIKKLDFISSEIHKKITDGREKLQLKYAPNIDFKDNIYEILKKSCDNDLRQRTTTRGPHKDDMELFINGINVRNFGSQGQQRTCALSLKLAEINIIEEETGEKPVLLLDDVMSELDSMRQKFLIKSLDNIQLFITTTELPESMMAEFPEKNIFFVENGKLQKKGN
ncbi:MAG: DNA replication/repair protein RecF [Anaerovoracaceae bacterium]|nr:DNA replication/repair protein RecF [Anaerovoracaceae bacterium]